MGTKAKQRLDQLECERDLAFRQASDNAQARDIAFACLQEIKRELGITEPHTGHAHVLLALKRLRERVAELEGAVTLRDEGLAHLRARVKELSAEVAVLKSRVEDLGLELRDQACRYEDV